MTLGPVGVRVRATWAALALAGPVLAGCGQAEEPAYDPAAMDKMIAAAVAGGLPSSRTTVLETLPHSTSATTEGLEVADGLLYESTELAGRSELRELDLKTGRLIRSAPVPAGFQGRGITVIGSLIWQLTYQDGVALQWDRESLNAGGRVPWPGSGGGLCHDESSLIASDGSNLLRVVDRNGVQTKRRVAVRLRGQPLAGLGELECLTNKRVAAVVSGTDWIVGIDILTGAVTTASNVSDILPAQFRGNREEGVSGFAAVPGTDNALVTGNSWPTMFRVRFTF